MVIMEMNWISAGSLELSAVIPCVSRNRDSKIQHVWSRQVEKFFRCVPSRYGSVHISDDTLNEGSKKKYQLKTSKGPRPEKNQLFYGPYCIWCVPM